MVTHLAPSVVNTLTRPDPARVYRTCTKRISLESSLKELSFKTITKSMGVSMKELWTEMCVLNKWYHGALKIEHHDSIVYSKHELILTFLAGATSDLTAGQCAL